MSIACAVEGCPKPAGVPGTAKGLCSMHYHRLRRNGDVNIRSKRVFVTHLPCIVEGCEERQAGRGLCATHWMQWKRTGNPIAWKARRWTPAEDARLLDLPIDPRTGAAPAGYVLDVALILGRSPAAARTRRSKLRGRLAPRGTLPACGAASGEPAEEGRRANT